MYNTDARKIAYALNLMDGSENINNWVENFWTEHFDDGVLREITWADFTKKFKDAWFPQHAKENAHDQLERLNMNGNPKLMVDDYITKFKILITQAEITSD